MTGYAGLTDNQLLQLLQAGPSPDASPTPQPAPVQTQALPPVPGAKASPDYNAGFDPGRLSDAQLQAYASDINPGMSAPEDFGRSVMGGLQRGMAALPTAGRGMEDMAQSVGQAGVDFLKRHGVDLGDLRVPAVGDMLHVPAAPGFGDALQTLTRLTAKGMHIDPTMAQMALDLAVPSVALSGNGPTPEQGAVALNGGLPIHQPQTPAGDYAQRIAEFAPGLTMPGGLVRKAANAVIPGVASQGAQDIAPESLKTPAALLGALLGGGVVESGAAVANAPYKLMGKAVSEMTPQDLAAAIARQQSAADLPGGGLHITPPEAVGTPAMLGLQHFAENAPAGRALAGPIFANRPQQVENVVRALADRLSPEDTAPSASALRNQDAATAVLMNAEKQRTAQTTPLYQAAAEQRVDPAAMEDILGQIDAEIARDHTGIVGSKLADLRNALIETPAQPGRAAVPAQRVPRETPSGTIYSMEPGSPAVAPTPRVPLTDIENLDRVRKYFRDRMALPQIGADAITKEQAARIAAHLGSVDGLMETVDPFKAGKELHAQITQDVVAPMQNGPVGRIANTSQTGPQVAAMFPAQPVEGTALETGAAAQALPPEVTANLVRHHLIDELNTANRDLQGGPNQWGGANLAKALEGHSERAAALDATLKAIDPSGDLGSTKDALMEALQATGRRLHPGSGTEFNRQQASVFGATPGPVSFMSKIIDPLEWGKHIDQAVGGKLYRRNVEQIVRMLEASPAEAGEILTNAKARSNGPLLLASPPARRR